MQRAQASVMRREETDGLEDREHRRRAPDSRDASPTSDSPPLLGVKRDREDTTFL